MGTFNVGDLESRLFLDDAQFNVALNRAGIGTKLFKDEINRLRTEVLNLLRPLANTEITIEEIAKAFGISDVQAEKYSKTIMALRAQMLELSNITGNQIVDERALAAQRVAAVNQYAEGLAKTESIEAAQWAHHARILAQMDAAEQAITNRRLARNVQEAKGAEQAAAIEAEARRLAEGTTTGSLGFRVGTGGITPRGYLGAGSGALLGTAAAAYGTYELIKMTTAAADAARETGNLADRLNITWQQARTLEQEAKLAGVSLGGLEQSSYHLSQALEEGSGAGKRTAETLEKLGITGKTSGELLLNVFTYLAGITDESKRIAILHDIFQRSSQQLVPLVKDLDKLNAEVTSLGDNLNENARKRLEEVAHATSSLHVAWGKFWDQISVNTSKPLTLVINTVTGWLTESNKPSEPTRGPESGKRGIEIAAQINAELEQQRQAQAQKDALPAAQAAAKRFRDLHHQTIDDLQKDLAETKKVANELREVLGRTLNPLPEGAERTAKEAEFKRKESEITRLEAAIKAARVTPESAATKQAQAAAQLEEAQTALNRFADTYNASFQLLTTEQRAFIESSFDNLNKILSGGTKTGNIATFRAALGEYQESLHRFAAEGKAALDESKLSESITVLSDKMQDASRVLTKAEMDYFSEWLKVIDAMIAEGTDPRLIEPQMKQLSDQLARSIRIGTGLQAEAKQMAHEGEVAFRLLTKEAKAAGNEMAGVLQGLSLVARLRLDQTWGSGETEGKQTGGIPESYITRLQNQSRIGFINQQMGLGGADKAEEFRKFVAEMPGLGATVEQVQRALIKLWEEEAKESGKSADQISHDQHYMINGVVQDYDLLIQKFDKTNGRWRELARELRRDMDKFLNDVIGGFANLIPVFDDTTKPLDNLTTSLRGAYEKLAAFGDPEKALRNMVMAIKSAGSEAEAQAIAVKYFGAQAGPLLAKDIRSGVFSLQEIDAAIKKATLSTKDYADLSNTSVSKVAQIWHKAITDIVQSITKLLVEQGLKVFIDWLFKVGKANSTLADDIVAAWHKIWGAIKGTGTQTGTNLPIPGVPTAPGAPPIPTTIPGTSPVPPSPPTPPVPNPAGNVLNSTVGGWVSLVSQAVTAISSVIGNFQMAGMNKSLDIIVHHTLEAANSLINLRRDLWDQHNQMSRIVGEQTNNIYNRLGEVWNSIKAIGSISSGGAGFDFTPLITNSAALLTLMQTAIAPDIHTLALSGGGSLSITVTGTFNGVSKDTASEVAAEIVRKVRQADIRRKF